ncbi:hypothetical protein O1611_g3960 [Lasiodiplodia mahajangana]|uniref:Uncharacterized protein n=1 Tax=Lasiodiplodia mahajangana TaxID=1108764 RepID=A0ACC2JQB3_9PEZI|nr:hypothetical protein O1611_g3960 [Lasiodiplodia mahajangana]
MATRPRTPRDYTVGWICATSVELTAAVTMLDQRHPELLPLPRDANRYYLGSIGEHDIVVASLLSGDIGTLPAATLATQMATAFPFIRFVMLAGIGSGIPTEVRLGDIVVGTSMGEYPEVVQWEEGVEEKDDRFMRTSSSNRQPGLLFTTSSTLQDQQELTEQNIFRHVDAMVGRYPALEQYRVRPGSDTDIIFKDDYYHIDDNDAFDSDDIIMGEEDEDEGERSCRGCDQTQAMMRTPRDMHVHYGLIASSNRVIENAFSRNTICEDLGNKVLCIETGGAKGVVDYNG